MDLPGRRGHLLRRSASWSGIPALRLKGLYLALVTLALAQIFPALIRKFDDLTGGSQGIDGLSYDAPGLDRPRARADGAAPSGCTGWLWARWRSATCSSATS